VHEKIDLTTDLLQEIGTPPQGTGSPTRTVPGYAEVLNLVMNWRAWVESQDMAGIGLTVVV
jgi:hypothetical protein